jgi:formate hydrogenlyase subunit 3/multisubunit Na+/H+ antiporter MnhD subunit
VTGVPDFLLVLALMVPVTGAATMFAPPVRPPERLAFAVLALGLVIAIAIAVSVGRRGAALGYAVGGWAAPLGLALRADGSAAALMLLAAMILCIVGWSAGPAFRTPEGQPEARAAFTFWGLLLALWGSINLAFMAQDLFTLFVALELLTFSAVPLAGLAGTPETLRAALRYLLVTLAGSVLYLLGTALIYAHYGALDLGVLRGLVRADWPTMLAVATMIAGLTVKTALFPLHLWLPPAHAGAPAPASAILSALVIKVPYFIILRLWFDLVPDRSDAAAALLAALGAASILFCSVVALRQQRLKLLVAYSTVAQVGYLFLIFPLATGPVPQAGLAWTGAILQLGGHAFAKAAMFVAAGRMAEALGHDRIDSLAGAAKAAPISAFAFAISGLALVGLPPSGGFNAKVMLLSVAVAEHHWWIVATILLGGIIASGYLFRVVGHALADPPPGVPLSPVPWRRELAGLALALCAVILGFVPLQPVAYLAIGALAAGQP